MTPKNEQTSRVACDGDSSHAGRSHWSSQRGGAQLVGVWHVHEQLVSSHRIVQMGS